MSEEKKSSKGKRALSFLLPVLFFVFSISSGMVGFVLGRGAVGRGELMDTIVLSPGDSSLRGQDTQHFLYGRLLYPDGTPCAGVTVQLGSEYRSDVTNEFGRFYISDVRNGDQVLSVIDDAGSLLAEIAFSLEFSGTDVSSGEKDGAHIFSMPEETRMLELTFTVGEDKTLTLKKETACFVTKDGQVVSFNGSAVQANSESYVVTPSAGLVDGSGYVDLLSKEITLTPQGGQVQTAAEEEISPGVTQQGNGSVMIAETGTVIDPDGTVELPDGETVSIDETVAILSGGEIEKVEIKDLPQQYTPPKDQTVADTSGDPVNAPTPTPAPVGPAVVDQSGDQWYHGASWQQVSNVDLFKKRYGKNRMEVEGTPMLGDHYTADPGDSGYYDFCLQNPEDYDIVYSVALMETTFHLPMSYTVICLDDNSQYISQEMTAGVNESLRSEEILLPAGRSHRFRIEWIWLERDLFDKTLTFYEENTAAFRRGGLYKVSLYINAYEVERSHYGGDIAYPGVRG